MPSPPFEELRPPQRRCFINSSRESVDATLSISFISIVETMRAIRMNDRRFPPFFFVLVLVEEMFDVAVITKWV